MRRGESVKFTDAASSREACVMYERLVKLYGQPIALRLHEMYCEECKDVCKEGLKHELQDPRFPSHV